MGRHFDSVAIPLLGSKPSWNRSRTDRFASRFFTGDGATFSTPAIPEGVTAGRSVRCVWHTAGETLRSTCRRGC